ncbi:MAG: OmpA family protein [Bacteroidota bacterium]
MHSLRVFFSLLFLTTTLLCFSQTKPKPADFGIKSKKAMNLYFDGLQQARYRAREQAIGLFKEAIEIEPDFAHAHFQLGLNAYVRKKKEDALTHLEKAYELRPSEFRSINFYLGETYFLNAKYEEAADLLGKFVAGKQGRKQDLARAARNLRHARFAAAAIQTPVDFKPINLGSGVNTDRDEYLPFLTADDQFLLFTSRRPEGTGGFNRGLGDYPEDFYTSAYQEGSWQKAKNLGAPINTEENEGAASISQDGRIIFFTACNLPDGIGSCDIYFSYREGDNWTEPVNLGPNVNTEAWESKPCLSADGKTLYFSSNQPGGNGGRDLWYSEYVGGQWTKAKNLGAPINTVGNEDSPFLHADGKSLYFSSDFHPGFGSRDLFVSYLSPLDEWTDPQNLGYPLNTSADENNIFISAGAKRGFMNSDREGGYGRSDLYEFTMDERIRPQIATFLRGITRDSITKTPVPSHITLVDVESGDTIRDMRSGRSDGKFLMSLPLEREYAALVTAKGYLFASKNFYLKDLPQETYFDLTIDLIPLKKGVKVVLNNIFFESGDSELRESSKAELAFLVYYMQQNRNMRIEIQGHTDDIGTDADNLRLSQSRANAVKAYLESQGIPDSRVQATGYGEKQAIAPNDTEEGRAKNRRTEFKVVSME